MSLETHIPKEINDYREKIVFSLSARQLAAVGVAVAVVGITAFFLYYLAGIDLKIVEYILILEAMPIVAVGFIRYKEMPFEEYVRIYFNHRFGTKRLLYKTDVDFLTSLYPMHPKTSALKRKRPCGRRAKNHESANEMKEGVEYRELSQREIKRRRKAQRECLQGDPNASKRKYRPRAKRHQPKEAARGEEA